MRKRMRTRSESGVPSASPKLTETSETEITLSFRSGASLASDCWSIPFVAGRENWGGSVKRKVLLKCCVKQDHIHCLYSPILRTSDCH